MLGAFWSSVGGKLADRLAAASAPALLFWLGGLLAWLIHSGGLGKLNANFKTLEHEPAGLQIAVIILALIVVAASGAVVQFLSTPVLRILEGYWPRQLARFRGFLIKRLERRARRQDAEWQRLLPRVQPSAEPTPDELSTFARLERARRRRPNAPSRYMPTRIGNILRAAETRPADKYGLDAVVLWPRLWLVLPDSTRSELFDARYALNSAISAGIWGVFFCFFAPLTFWAIPVGIAIAVGAVTVWAPARAEAFGELVEASYDLYRGDLYRQLRWPLPADPKDELAQGESLTSYLWRGSDNPSPKFTPAQ